MKPETGHRLLCPLPFTLEDSVRVRDVQTDIFRVATIVVIASHGMTVQCEDSLVPIVVPLKSVKRHGAESDYADGSSGLGGGCSRKSTGLKSKRTKTGPDVTGPTISWSLDRIAKFYMKDANDASVASRTTMVYHSSHVGARGDLLPQEPEEIGLVEALQNDTVHDMYVGALGKFHSDLYLTTPSDAGMISMLVSLEPMCMGEEVLERNATVEEHTEREEIYKKHLQAQAALTSATFTVAAAADAAAGTGADVAQAFDVVAHFLAD